MYSLMLSLFINVLYIHFTKKVTGLQDAPKLPAANRTTQKF